MSAIAQIDIRLYDHFVALRDGLRRKRPIQLLIQCTVVAVFATLGVPRALSAGSSAGVAGTLGSGVTPSRVLIEPDDGVNPLVRAIDRANRSIWVETYFISHKRIIRGLERAAAQGVDVRVLLARNPYGLGDQPLRMANVLRAAGIAIRWAPARFAFDHAKVMLLDSRLAIISTANFSLAGFSTDRDVLVFDRHAADARAISAIFRSDWDRLPAHVSDANLVVSPANARAKLDGLVARARSSIDIYAEEFADARLKRLLTRAARRGIKVRILLPPGAISTRRTPIEIRTLRVPYIHAKVVMVDRTETFVGSENISAESLDRNREIGILLRGTPRRLARVFRHDWLRARAR